MTTENLQLLFQIVVCLTAFKAMTVGSNLNFIKLFKYRGKYWAAYKNWLAEAP